MMKSFLQAGSARLGQVALGLLLACAACTAPPKKVAAQSIRLDLVDARTEVHMGLVSDTWLRSHGIPGATAEERRVNFASIRRTAQDSTTKVLTDEQLAGLLQYLREECGFDRYSQVGGTETTLHTTSSALILELDGQTPRHFAYRSGMSRDAQTDFVDAKKAFFEVYNAVFSLQSVQDLKAFEQGKR